MRRESYRHLPIAEASDQAIIRFPRPTTTCRHRSGMRISVTTCAIRKSAPHNPMFSGDDPYWLCRECEGPVGEGAQAIDAVDGVKLCSSCGQPRRIGQYLLDKSSTDGRGSVCRYCRVGRGVRKAHSVSPPETKKCSKCKKKLSKGEFYPDARNRDGLESSCKRCRGRRKRQDKKEGK